MKPTITRIILSALALVTVTPLAQQTNSPPKPVMAGKEYTHPIRYEIWAPKEVKGSANEVYRLWIPDSVRKVRAVIVVPDYAMDREIYFSEELGYRQFAEKMDFALMAYRVFNEDSDKTRDLADARLNPWWYPHDHLYTPANDGTGGPFTIGRVIHSSRSVGFTGWIGGVAVFNRALGAEDMARLSAIVRDRPLSVP